MAAPERTSPSITSPLVLDLAAVRACIVEMVAKGAIVALIDAILGLLTRMRDLNTDLVRQVAEKRRARPPSERGSALQAELPFAWTKARQRSGHREARREDQEEEGEE